jgi:hypothetical protein
MRPAADVLPGTLERAVGLADVKGHLFIMEDVEIVEFPARRAGGDGQELAQGEVKLGDSVHRLSIPGKETRASVRDSPGFFVLFYRVGERYRQPFVGRIIGLRSACRHGRARISPLISPLLFVPWRISRSSAP